MKPLAVKERVLSPKGIGLISSPAKAYNGHPWWWVTDTTSGTTDIFPASELAVTDSSPSPLELENLRYEVTARTLKVEAIESCEGRDGIRVTHVPTGLVTQHVKFRSQHRNRDEAITRLKERIAKLRGSEMKSKRREKE